MRNSIHSAKQGTNIVVAIDPMSIGEFHRRETCRGCKSVRLFSFLDYGNVPLAGDFLLPDQVGREKLYPMDLVVCLDCSLVQIANVIDATDIFDDYRYLSSITHTLMSHFKEYARTLSDRILESKDELVVEFGCNDGVLLSPLKELGVRAVGVDAAENVVRVARDRGFEVEHGFFGLDLAKQIGHRHGNASVITASNVFAHIDNLDDVMLGVDQLLTDSGSLIVEVHYLVDLIEKCQFDTVYHEHLCYYSLHALTKLFNRFDFTITDVERLPMHGGAIRVRTQRASHVGGRSSETVDRLLAMEGSLGVGSELLYRRFGAEVLELRDSIFQFVNERSSRGHSISAYGAAGRATTLLNFCKIDQDILSYVVDESPSRIGRVVPGVRIPIVPRSYFADHPTDDCLLTAWNYRQEIVNKEQDYLLQGGRFLAVLPEIEVIRRSVECRKSA